MAIGFTNIFMAKIENQTLRQSCIEPYPAHQRIFLTCGGMLQFRLQAGRSLAEGRSHLRQNREKRFEKKKKAYRVGHYKDFTEPETCPKNIFLICVLIYDGFIWNTIGIGLY